MFTGIITDVGRVRSIKQTARDRRYEIETAYDLAGVDIGASISHSGCCLTVVEKGDRWFAVEVSGETLSARRPSASKAMGDPGQSGAGGAGRRRAGRTYCFRPCGRGGAGAVGDARGRLAPPFKHPLCARAPLHRFIARKGSIAVDGVSLTVNEVEDDVFELNIIPHTWEVTTLGRLKPRSQGEPGDRRSGRATWRAGRKRSKKPPTSQ